MGERRDPERRMEMKHLFPKEAENRADDLALWANQIKSLAKVICLIADEKWNGNPPTGEEICDLASTILDYAEAIEGVADEAFISLLEFYQSGGSKSESLFKSQLKHFKEGTVSGSAALKIIDESLERINVILAKNATFYDVRKEFIDLRSEIAAKVG